MAKKITKDPKPPKTSTPCPFTILVDKNEYLPHHDGYKFLDIPSNADTDYLPYEINIVSRHLDHLGDYSAEFPDIAPFEQPKIMVERKSKADLYGSITKRDNFEERLNRLSNECEFAVIVVEATLESLMDPPPHTDQTFKVVHSTIQAWQMRYSRVQWMFYPCREDAELGTFRYLYRFYDCVKNHKLDRDRNRRNYQVFLEGMLAYKKKVKPKDNPYRDQKLLPFGNPGDYWLRGFCDQERISTGKPINTHERHLIPDEVVGANSINGITNVQ